jgi:tetratricopeptide (TPR) repeat protein
MTRTRVALFGFVAFALSAGAASQEELIEAIDQAPASREAYKALSDLYMQAGRHADAVELFAKLGAQHETSHAWYFKGQHEAKLGLWDAVEESWKTAVVLDPTDANFRFRFGSLLFGRAKFELAAEEFRKAYELDPRSLPKATMLSRTLRISGDYAGAEQVVQQALQIFPDSAELLYALGQLRIRQGRDQEAEIALRRAIALDPTADAPHRELGQLILRNGREDAGRRRLALAERLKDYNEISRNLRAQMESAPEDPQIPLLLAELELTVRNNGAALQWLSRAETLGAPLERVAAARAWIYFSKGQMERGEAQLGQVRDSLDGRVELARAVRLVKLHKNTEAVRVLQRAVSVGPATRNFLRRAADLYVLMGLEVESNALLMKASTAATREGLENP